MIHMLRFNTKRITRMFTRLLLIIVLLLAFLGTRYLPVYANESTVVRVGVFDFGGFYQVNDLGIRFGYGYDYLNELAKYTDFKYEFVEGTWNELQIMLQNGDIDLLDSAQFTEQRAENYNFSTLSTGISYGALFARADNDQFSYNDFTALNNCKVGLLTGNTRNEGFFQFEKYNNFQTEHIEYSDTYMLEKALQDGLVDAIVTSNLRNNEGEKEIAKFSPSSFYMITNKSNTQLMEKINVALEHIQTNSPYFNQTLF